MVTLDGVDIKEIGIVVNAPSKITCHKCHKVIPKNSVAIYNGIGGRISWKSGRFWHTSCSPFRIIVNEKNIMGPPSLNRIWAHKRKKCTCK